MRTTLTILFFAWAHSILAQDTIVKLLMIDKTKVGHSVEMFFIADDFSKIKTKIIEMESPSEREIINLFGIPLIDPNTATGECESSDTLNQQNQFLLRHKKKATLEKGNYIIELYFSAVKIDYCIFVLHGKYWGSYDVAFKRAAVVTSYASAGRLSKNDKMRIEELINLLREKL